jgi:hypothetical protein
MRARELGTKPNVFLVFFRPRNAIGVMVIFFVFMFHPLKCVNIPCQGLSKEQICNLRRAIRETYARGFLAGTIGLGYLLLILHILALLDRSHGERLSFLPGVIFLIILGTIAQARAAIQFLAKPQEGKIQPLDNMSNMTYTR